MNLASTLEAIHADAKAAHFGMGSDELIGRLLATLASSKPGGRLLELGTGAGLGTATLLGGMSPDAHLVSVDNNPDLTKDCP